MPSSIATKNESSQHASLDVLEIYQLFWNIRSWTMTLFSSSPMLPLLPGVVYEPSRGSTIGYIGATGRSDEAWYEQQQEHYGKSEFRTYRNACEMPSFDICRLTISLLDACDVVGRWNTSV
jgi:hypothetical protein